MMMGVSMSLLHLHSLVPFSILFVVPFLVLIVPLDA